jgi:TPR repeat protein
MRTLLIALALSIAANAYSPQRTQCNSCYYDCTIDGLVGNGAQFDRLGVEHYRIGDYARAIIYHYQACIEGSASGCNHAGYMYDVGKGVAQDHTIASKYFTLACKYGSSMGCSNLGVLYEWGQGVEQSDIKAKHYYEKSCNLKNDEGCRNLKLLKKYMILTK